MSASIRNITFDANDPKRLAAFWAAALEWELRDGFVIPPPDSPRLNFERVPEPKRAKNRVHLDVMNVDERVTHVERLERLGASKRGEVEDPSGDYSWTVLSDPEGNEFCVVDLAPL